MPYNENLAKLIREALANLPNVEEKKMFRGLTFMVDQKMLVSIGGNEMMCRIAPEIVPEVLEKEGCRQVVMRGKAMKGYIWVDETYLQTRDSLKYWIGLALEFNSRARATKKKLK